VDAFDLTGEEAAELVLEAPLRTDPASGDPASSHPASGDPASSRPASGDPTGAPPPGRPPLSGHPATLRLGSGATERSVACEVLPELGADGELSGWIGLVTGHDSPRLPVSQRLLETLVDTSPDIISVLDSDGSWRYSNATAWRLLGYRRGVDSDEGMLGLVHPDDLPAAEAALEAVVAGEPPSTPVALRIRAVDGSWRSFETITEDLRDDPVVRGIVLRSRDTTERIAAREQLVEAHQRLSTVIDSLPIAALLEDEDRTVLLTNEAFVELFDIPRSPDDLTGRSLEQLRPVLSLRFGDPTRDPSPERLEKILAGRRTVLGDRIPLADGRVLERDYVPVHVDGEIRGHLWIFRDVSEQAQTEAVWEQLLETQWEENRKLVELDEAKSAFLAEISHELRTPLTSILSFTELLGDGLGRDRLEEQREFLDVISRNASRLIRLVDDLVLLDRIETGKIGIEWGSFDVPSLVTASVSSFTPTADRRGISLETEIGEGPPLCGDAHRVAQVLDVLLSNAVKFTPDGGRIFVTARPVGRAWQLEVTDSGIGVPAAERESLFERFYRASNARAARVPGSGLGLSIARAIAELHGGSIELGDAEQRGTVVTVRLPIGDRKAPAEQ
jgi:PAS domain S-box-containing protein